MSCGGTAKRSFSPADRTSVEKVLDDQREAWNRGDIEAFMQGYVQGPDLVFTSGAQIRRGWQVTLDRYRARYGNDTSTMGKLAFEVLEVQALGADGAVVLGRWGLSGLDAPAGGVFSVVLERLEDGWRIVHDHTSSDPPPQDEMPEEA
jgi:ketosteroid isomerase-like protein